MTTCSRGGATKGGRMLHPWPCWNQSVLTRGPACLGMQSKQNTRAKMPDAARCIAVLRKQLMDDSRHGELVSEPRSHFIQECRDLHFALQKGPGKTRVSCQVLERDQPPLHVQHFEIKSAPTRHSRTRVAHTGNKVLPEEDYLLGSTTRTRFPASRACERYCYATSTWGGKPNP